MNKQGGEAGYRGDFSEHGGPRSSNSNEGGQWGVVLHLSSSRKRENRTVYNSAMELPNERGEERRESVV